MDWVATTGVAAAVLTTAASLPQAIKIIRTRSVKDISALTYTLLFTGLTLWTIYGIAKNDWPIMLCNGLSAIISGIVLVLKLTIKKQEEH